MNSYLSLAALFHAQPVLNVRLKEIRLRLKKLVKRFPGVQLDLDAFEIHFDATADRECVEGELKRLLGSISRRPYTAGEVRERLGITNKERMRWTKDGRLKRGGYDIVNRGQKIAVTTYDLAAIDALAASPEIIEGWRRERRARKGSLPSTAPPR